jgi:acylphosphatase
MTISVRNHSSGAISIFVEGTKDVAAFKQMVQRGTNLYPDTPGSIKLAADLITLGAAQQDYLHITTVNSDKSSQN